MKSKNAIKALVASLLVTVAVAAPAALLALRTYIQPNATLSFTGAEMKVMDDGSVQVRFDVIMDAACNSMGADFSLNYNSDYLTPSHWDTNAALDTSGEENNDAFFHYNEELLVTTAGAVNPFAEIVEENYYSRSDTGNELISMKLQLDEDMTNGVIAKAMPTMTSSKIETLKDATTFSGVNGSRYVFNMVELENDPDDMDIPIDPLPSIKLGSLSFRVKEGKLAEVYRYFNGMNATHGFNNVASSGGDGGRPLVTVGNQTGVKLLETVQGGTDSWLVYAFEGRRKNAPKTPYGPNLSTASDEDHKRVAEHYEFNFAAKTVVSVEATEPEFTINAYQNYTDGTMGDLSQSLLRYSPTVTVTYADGSQENIAFPWGDGAADYSAVYADDDSAVTSGNYDPTATSFGTVYRFSQKYQYTDASGNTVTFPVPVTAKMTVTPITVLKLTAEDLQKTYTVQGAVELVPEAGKLELPTEARIITDVVPANVALVVPLKRGWEPRQAGSVMPDPATAADPDKLMNSLIADQADLTIAPADGKPYWPDDADLVGGATAENHVGKYSFKTVKESDPTANPSGLEGVLKAEIQAAYPWLTVPKANYEVDPAYRNIVEQDIVEYTARWTSTKTQTGGYTNPNTHASSNNGDGQPILTLTVARADENASLAEKSVFRVWLPNGLELGTGQNKGGVKVDDWFGTSDDHGYYYTLGVSTATGQRTFNLITNPADSADGKASATERETLRRYINLGGWFYVSVCEDPDLAAPTWSDRIPVYVPPRQNEYEEDKVYNFLASQEGLMNWAGGVGDTLHLPRGTYQTLYTWDKDTANNTDLGLPVYEKLADGTLTAGLGSDNTLFHNQNLFDPDLEQLEIYEERYGVKTTYDGQTGAQPGYVYDVKVDTANSTDGVAWTDGDHSNKVSSVVDAAAPKAYEYGSTQLYQGETKAGNTIDGYAVAGFGTVYNSAGHTATLRNEGNETPAVVEQIQLLSAEVGNITRRKASNGADKYTPSSNLSDNVALVNFNNVNEGYTVRQEYVLTIKNVGTADIYGLSIDSTFDGYDGGLGFDSCASEPQGGHFKVIKQPASFLPVGATTTFTLTYDYNLSANGAEEKTYHDVLYITSNSHHNVKRNGTFDTPAVSDDYLMEFEAHLTVTPSELFNVEVIYRPTNGNMGTANLIAGARSDGSVDTTAAVKTYSQGDKVYVIVNKKDEYAVKDITYTYAGITTPINLTLHTPPAGDTSLSDEQEVYFFTMPKADVTVVVNFYEPLLSKMRLEDLIDFSAPNKDKDGDSVGDDLKQSVTDTVAAEYTYTVWQKQYSAAEESGAAAWLADANLSAADEDLYRMSRGSAGVNSFDSSNNQYLVVIDTEDDFSQVQAKLRRVVYHEDYRETDADHPNGFNEEIAKGSSYNMKISMQVYATGADDAAVWKNPSWQPEVVLKPEDAFTGTNGTATDGTAVPLADGSAKAVTDSSEHLSDVFRSPAAGASKYVRILVTATDTDGTSAERSFYLEIHRRPEKVQVQLNYGNSPYGMIMNESRWNSADKAAKKLLFKENYSFRGLTAADVPSAATDGGLTAVTYWREAWIRNEGLYEAESLTGTKGTYSGKPSANTNGQNLNSDDKLADPIDTDPKDALYSIDQAYMDRMAYPNDKMTASVNPNLDLDDYAYFAILGEDFREPGIWEAYDSSGRAIYQDGAPVDPARVISVKAEVTLLDTAAATQAGRFGAGAILTTVTLDFGECGKVLTQGNRWPLLADGTAVSGIRPGRYELEYTFTDFDGTGTLTFRRPFVVLAQVGDVDADLTRTAGSDIATSDEYRIENRVTDPLGYTAGKWNAAGGKETVYPAANLFKLRVCDVNNDRSVNNIDANTVYKAKKNTDSTWLKFYEPVYYGLETKGS